MSGAEGTVQYPLPDPLGGVELNDLRKLPDGCLTREEVNLLIDYIERLEDRLLG